MAFGIVTGDRRRSILMRARNRSQRSRIETNTALCHCSGLAYRIMVWAMRHAAHPDR